MKHIILTLVLLISANGFAQRGDRGESREQLKALAIAHITRELDLTADEAQKFWPIYNEVEDNKRSLEREKRSIIKAIDKSGDAMTEAEAMGFVNKLVEVEKKLNKARMEARHKDIIAIIGAKRFLKLKKAELDFRKKMLKEYRKRRGGKR